MARAAEKRRKYIEEWAQAHRMIPDDLDELGNKLKTAYIVRRRQTFPGYSMHPRHGQDFWRNIAIFVITNDLEPSRLVNAVCDKYGPEAYPETLGGNTAIAIYRDYGVSDSPNARRIKLELDASLNRTMLLLEHGDSLEKILEDRANGFSALFVLCVANKYGLLDIAARARSRAQILYTRPLYREIYGQIFPEICQ